MLLKNRSFLVESDIALIYYGISAVAKADLLPRERIGPIVKMKEYARAGGNGNGKYFFYNH
jgi:hypothetical protein